MWVATRPGAERRRCRGAGRGRRDGVRCERLDGSDRDRTGAAGGAADGDFQRVIGRGPDVVMATDVYFTGPAGRHVPCRCRRQHTVHSRGRLSQPGTRQPVAVDLRPGVRAHRARCSCDGDGAGRIADSSNCMKPWAIPGQVDRQPRRHESDRDRSRHVDARTTASNCTAAERQRTAARESGRLHAADRPAAPGRGSPRSPDRKVGLGRRVTQNRKPVDVDLTGRLPPHSASAI